VPRRAAISRSRARTARRWWRTYPRPIILAPARGSRPPLGVVADRDLDRPIGGIERAGGHGLGWALPTGAAPRGLPGHSGRR
jgi:hypothetical protein